MSSGMGRTGRPKTHPEPQTLPALVDDGERHLGPAMLALTPMQRGFVQAIVTTGANNAKAAELAGYQGGPATWRANGWRLAHDPAVLEAIHEESRKLLRSGAAVAVRALRDVIEDPTSEARDKIRASVELLNRSGLSSVSEQHITVEKRDATEADQIARVVRLSKDLGLDPKVLLGQIGFEYREIVASEPIPTTEETV